MSEMAPTHWPQELKAQSTRARVEPLSSLDWSSAQRVDLGELMRQVVSQMEVCGLLRGVEVLMEMPGEQVHAQAVRWKLERMAFNLLANAAESLEKAGGTGRSIRVLVEAADSFGDYGPTLHVRDSGPALTEGELYSTLRPTACEERGHLSAARVLAEELGGELTVKSRSTGTTISVELPGPALVSW